MKERPIIFTGESVRAILDGRKTQTRRLLSSVAQENIRFMGCEEDDKGQPCESDAVIRFGDGWGGQGWYVSCGEYPEEGSAWVGNRYGAKGDHLWVRETWARRLDEDEKTLAELAKNPWAWYWADPQTCNTGCAGAAGKRRSPIYMPRWASRIDLEVTEVRVQRLQDISEEDARAEGLEPSFFTEGWACMTEDGHSFDVFVEPSAEMREREKLVAVVHQPAKLMSTSRERFARAWDAINGKKANWASNPWVWAISFRVLPRKSP